MEPPRTPAVPSPALLMLLARLKRLRLRPSLGQHFLVDPALLDRIAAMSGADAHTLVVEIGPGAGTLTAALAARAGGVLAVELDRRWQPLHEQAFGSLKTVRFEYGDALQIDLPQLARQAMQAAGLERVVLAGNIPFQISSPLLHGLCGPDRPWARVCLTVQAEVADRLFADPGSKAYGLLTVKMALWWRRAGRLAIDARRFTPRPQVDAATVAWDPAPAEQAPTPAAWPSLVRFLEAAFAHRRKTLVNSLAGAWPDAPPKPRLEAALAAAGLDARVRAETLAPDALVALHAALTRPGDR